MHEFGHNTNTSKKLSSHDLEGYFESPALRGFQNNLFLVLARKNGG